MIDVCWGSIHVKFDGAFTAIMILQSGESKQFGDLTQTESDCPTKTNFPTFHCVEQTPCLICVVYSRLFYQKSLEEKNDII